MDEIDVKSTCDGSLQPSLFFHPRPGRPVPLVVGLHTWSFDRFNQRENYLPLCRRYGWALLLPEFRGPNLAANPQVRLACGSAVARRDVIDAVEHVVTRHAIDRSHIFLLGCSGGGQMALLTAAAFPAVFRAVDVWCPVVDLRRWHDRVAASGLHYAGDIEAALGGVPAAVPDECRERSPAARPEALRTVTLSIHHGRGDDLVPWRHSFEFAMALEASGAAALYYDFFDGGHEQFPQHSFEWFARLAGTNDAGTEITR